MFEIQKSSIWQHIKDWWKMREFKKRIMPDVEISIAGIYEPEFTPIPCATCGKPSIGAIFTITNDSNVEITIDKVTKKYRTYCKDHENAITD